MSQGSVTIADDGAVTSSGLAGAIYAARVAMLADVDPPGEVPAGPAGVPLKRGLALDANALAAAIYPEITGALPASIPVGTIAAFGLATPPLGWFLCGGATVSRTAYAALFAVIGTTFGAGDGSTTFTLPNIPALAVGVPYIIKA